MPRSGLLSLRPWWEHAPPEDMDSGEKKALLCDIGKALKLQGSTLATKNMFKRGIVCAPSSAW